MSTLTGRAALVGVALALAVASPAYATERNIVTLSPADVAIGPNGGATQTITIDGDQGAEVSVEFSPQPPIPGRPDITRRNGNCNRHGGANYVCDGFGTVTIRYPATEATGLEVSITVRVSDGRAVYGSVTVESPPPPTSDPPPPSDEPAAPQQELTPAPVLTSDPPSSTSPPATSAEALPPPQDAGTGLTTVALYVGGSVGAVGTALAAAAVVSIRRRREALRAQPRGPRPDVTVVEDPD